MRVVLLEIILAMRLEPACKTRGKSKGTPAAVTELARTTRGPFLKVVATIKMRVLTMML